MAELYPDIEPYDEGMLDVGDGNLVHWDVAGNPDGRPVVMVHGGPGTGCAPGMRRGFDPARYRIVLFDQRGSGLSTPHASDPTADMSVNTTHHLIADMERLREHLGIERWMLSGGSWGSTLALAYAQRHPERVTEIVLSAITSGRRREAGWLYDGVSRFFPEEYELFRDGVPEQLRTGDLVADYGRLMENPDRAVRERTAQAWSRWENAVLSLEPNAKILYGGKDLDAMIAMVRICAHYISHDVWLEDGELIRDAGKLKGIPGVLIHGRLDLSCPVDTAWEIAQAWPDAELIVLDDTGHKGSPSKRAVQLAALDRFASR